MKKIISVFIVFISFLVFHISFQEYGEIERLNLENPTSSISKALNQTSYRVVLTDDGKGNLLEDIMDFADENDLIVFASRGDQNPDFTYVSSYYVYTKDCRIFDGTFFLYDGKQICFDDHNAYYTTNVNDEQATGYIETVNREYLKAFGNKFEFHYFDRFFEKGEQPFLAAWFITAHPEKFIYQLNHSNLKQYIREGDEASIFHSAEKPAAVNQLIVLLLFVSLISMVLLFLCKIVQERKEILIRKMQGMSSISIFMRKYLWELLAFFLIYIVVQIICFYFAVGKITAATHGLIDILLRYFTIYSCMILVLAVVMILFIWNRKEISSIKRSNTQKQIPIINMILKIVVIILIIEPLISFTKTGIRQAQTALYMNEQGHVLSNLLFIYGLKENTGNLGPIIIKMREYFNENGGWYQDWRKYIPEIKYPYVVVNQNYLENYDLYTTDGKKLDLSKLKQDQLLVPEKYQYQDLSYYGMENNKGYYDGEIIVLKNGYHIDNLDVYSSMNGFLGADDPIIYVKTKMDSDCQWNYSYMTIYLDDEQKKEKLNQYLHEVGLEDEVLLATSQQHYQIMKEKVKDDLISVLSLFVIYLVIICTFLYENIFIYFIENKTKFAVRYLNGSSYWERHGDMIKLNLGAYAIPLLYGYFRLHIALFDILAFTALAMIVELAAAYVIITHFEKNRIVEVLKGE